MHINVPKNNILTTARKRMKPTQRSIQDLYSKPLALYIHIPYCRRRCRYCNFPIVPIGSQDTTANSKFEVIDFQYRQAILNEIDLVDSFFRQILHCLCRLGQQKIELRSVYFGGGTPSLAPVETIRAIMDVVRDRFVVEENAEITIEMDPGRKYDWFLYN